MNSYRYIVVEGVIGVGKTTLVELLAKDLGAKSYLEIVEENPFLVKGFYEDIEANAFNTELYFLLSRFRQQRLLMEDLSCSSQCVISDYLFAKNRIFAGLTLKGNDLDIFDLVFQPLHKKVAAPDLIIYLRADVDGLMRRIGLRDRSFERKMDPRYMQHLTEGYEEFFKNYDEAEVMTIDASEIDFVFNLRSYSEIKNLVGKKMREKEC